MSLDKDQAMRELSTRYELAGPPATAGASGQGPHNASGHCNNRPPAAHCIGATHVMAE
jgi:hypothetical protein